MSGLVYHPAFDPYGSLLRSVRYLTFSTAPAEKDQVRLFDFLILFPEALEGRNLGRTLGARFRKMGTKRRFQYEERPDVRMLFERMAPTFEAAFQTMVGKGFIERDADQGERWSLRSERLPTRVAELANERNEREVQLVTLLKDLNSEFEFNGAGGLKDRTGLMEFRYDIL